eukprot:m51a1_g8051 hypothetical protein (666) ;mRNA; f:101862-103859
MGAQPPVSPEEALLHAALEHVLLWLAPRDALELSRASRSLRGAVLALSPAWSSRLPVLAQPALPPPPGLGPLVRLRVCEPPRESPGASDSVLALLASPACRCAALRAVAFSHRSALCSPAVLRALADLDAPLADVRVAVSRRHGPDPGPAAAAALLLARRHAPTLRTLHVACCPDGGSADPFAGPGDPGRAWSCFPTRIACVGDAVARGLAEGYARMPASAAAPLESLVLEAVSAGAVLQAARSAPGGVLARLEELVGLGYSAWERRVDEEALAEVARRCPRLRRAQRAVAPGVPEEAFADASLPHLPYTSLVLGDGATELLRRCPGPYPLVSRLAVLVPHCLPALQDLAAHFPAVETLVVEDDADGGAGATAEAVVAAVRRFGGLGELSWLDAPQSLPLLAAGLPPLRRLAIDAATGRNAWAALAPGVLRGVETLAVGLGAVPPPEDDEVPRAVRERLRLDVSPALERLTLRMSRGAHTVPRACELVAEVLRKGTELRTVALECEAEALPTLARGFASAAAAGAAVPQGCLVTLELCLDGADDPQIGEECRGLVGRVQELKGRWEALRLVAHLCSELLSDVWILLDDVEGRDWRLGAAETTGEAASVAEQLPEVERAVRELPRSCRRVHTTSSWLGTRLRHTLGSAYTVEWEMPCEAALNNYLL